MPESGFSGCLAQPRLLDRQRLGHEALEEGLQVGEDRRDVGGAVAGVELLHQRVIGSEAERVGAQGRFFAHQRHDALEGRLKARPVVLGAQVAPQLLAAHARRRLAFDEFDRQAGQVGVVAAQFGEGRPLLVVERLVFGGGDPVGDFGRGRPGVIHAGQRRHRLGALLAAADGHVRRFIGAEDGQRMLKRFELVAEIVEFLKGHGGFRD